jgi:chromosomal replication initiation ATPase DnaA
VYRSLANEQGPPLDISIRRIEVPPSPQEILAAVEGKFGVTVAEWRKRRSASDARLLAMKRLSEEEGLSQRKVAIQLGLRDGSGVSRHLSDLRNRRTRERKLKRKFDRIRKSFFHNQ